MTRVGSRLFFSTKISDKSFCGVFRAKEAVSESFRSIGLLLLDFYVSRSHPTHDLKIRVVHWTANPSIKISYDKCPEFTLDVNSSDKLWELILKIQKVFLSEN